MNVQVLKNGDDITNKVISYERNLSICTGIGTLNVTMELVSGIDFYPWDEITIYEEGVKKGIFLVSDITKDNHLATITISCLDFSKKLLEYYVTDVYEIDYVSYTRYWLELFLDQAGVNYSINVTGSGSIMSNNTSIGPEQAYDIVLRLLQMSGWYMYFDADGVCQIGTLTIDTDNYDHTFIGTTQVSNIATNTNDQMLRNRAVVWGASDPITEQWVFADRSVDTPYNYDSQDRRAAVLANSNIDSVGAANVLAGRMLNEFARITYEKTITLIGAPNVLLGQVVFVSTAKKSTVGMVTSLTSSMSSSGLTTVLVLDQRCPRLFGYYGYLGYVYIGTYGSGVWRKLIEGSTWSNFSTGITDLHVIDLYIRDGIFACVTGDGNGYFRNLNLSAWQMVEKPSVFYVNELEEDVEVLPNRVKIIGCTVNTEGNIEYLAIYRHNEEEIFGFNKSWVLEYSPLGVLIRTAFVQTPGLNNQLAIDIDSNSESNIITTKISNRSIFLVEGDDGNFGTRSSHPYDGNMIPALPPVTHPEYQMARMNYTITETTRKRGETVFIQNTEIDKGIVYYFWAHVVNFVVTFYVTKAVYVEKLGEFGVYTYFSDLPEDGGFRKMIPASMFGTEASRIMVFHVINDNRFSFVTQDARWFSNSPDTGEGNAWVAIYMYDSHEGEEEDGEPLLPTMERRLLLSSEVVEDWGSYSTVVAYGKCAMVYKAQHIESSTYALGAAIIDLVNGTIISRPGGVGTITTNSQYSSGVFKKRANTEASSCYTLMSPLVLAGRTASLIYMLAEGYDRVETPNPDALFPDLCDCGTKLNSDLYAATVFAYVVEFNLTTNNISFNQIGNDAIFVVSKIATKEKDYINTVVRDTNGSYCIVTNQDTQSGTALLRMNLEFGVHRYVYSHNGGLCLSFFPFCFPVFPFEAGEHYIRSYTFSLPLSASGGAIGGEQSSVLTWGKGIGTRPGSVIDNAENFETFNMREFHFGNMYVHALQPLYSHKEIPIVVDNAGNWFGRATGTPVFRNGITFEIISGVEIPIGLGEDLENRTTEMAWEHYDNNTSIDNNKILISKTFNTRGTLQDEIDDTRYVLIHKHHGGPTSYYSWATYLVGYNSVGNITKRFYQPYTKSVYNEFTNQYNEFIYHREMMVGSNTSYYMPFELNIQGNILQVEYDQRFTSSSHRFVSKFIKFYDYELEEFIQDRYLVLRQDYSNFNSFTQIQEHTYPMRVDISKEAPTVIYSRVVGSGVASITRTSYSNAVDDYNFVNVTRRIPVHEARSFSVMDEDNFYIYSGSLDEIAFDYVLVASNTDVRFIESSLAGEWNTLASFGELVSHVETTNFTDNPYFFISTSGETASSFYQRNNDGVSFIQYNSGLPSGSGITIIRTDDRI